MVDPRPNDIATEESADGPGSLESPRSVSDDYLDEQEDESFPASDPHSDWAGPPAG
jgi:hypothetical protein